MKSKVGFFIGVIGLIFSLSVLNAADEVNLLVNGDLQDGGGVNTPGWTFSIWNLKEGSKELEATKWGIAAEKGNEANKCLWIGINAKAHIWFQQEVKCDPSETYTLTFRAKGTANACGMYIIGTKGEWLTFEGFKDMEPTTEWKTYTEYITTPDNAAKIGVRLGFGVDGQYDIFFDDMKLVKGKLAPAK